MSGIRVDRTIRQIRSAGIRLADDGTAYGGLVRLASMASDCCGDARVLDGIRGLAAAVIAGARGRANA